ncbi:hypothetical protein BSKO_08019 [Bryopsis sp. KO-2023]|nr:hypothetical protein BSKO_08019 [Bryopsis sp. KO-2023]
MINKPSRLMLQQQAIPKTLQRNQLSFLSAVRAGDIGRVKQLLQRYPGARLHETASPKGTPAIWSAAYNGHVEISRLLTDSGASVNSPNANLTSPSYAAAQRGHIEVLKLLVQQGANLNQKSLWGSTPLMIASQNREAEVVNWLIQRDVNLDAQTFMSKQTALWSASFEGYHDIVKSLLDAGAEVEAKDVRESTPLFAAAQEGHEETVRILLNGGADPNARDKTGNTPLHVATAMCRVEIIKMLLKNGANISVTDTSGRTPGDGDIVCFRRQEADSVAVEVQLLTNPVMVAVQNGDIDAVKESLKSKENLGVTLRNGWTGLHLAAARGDPNIVGEFVRRGAKRDAEDIIGLKPSDVIGSQTKLDDETRQAIAAILNDSDGLSKPVAPSSPARKSKFPVLLFLLVSIGVPVVCCAVAVIAVRYRQRAQELANASQRINTWLITESPSASRTDGRVETRPLGGGAQDIFYNTHSSEEIVEDVENPQRSESGGHESLLPGGGLSNIAEFRPLPVFRPQEISSFSPRRPATSLSTNGSVTTRVDEEDTVVRETSLDVWGRRSTDGPFQQEDAGERLRNLEPAGLHETTPSRQPVEPGDEEGRYHKPQSSLSFSGLPSHEFLPPPELFVLQSEGLMGAQTVGLKVLASRHRARNTAYATFSSTWTSESSGKGPSPGPSGSTFQDHEVDTGGVPADDESHRDKFWELDRMVRSGGEESGQHPAPALDVSGGAERKKGTSKDRGKLHSHSLADFRKVEADASWTPLRRTLSADDLGKSWGQEIKRNKSDHSKEIEKNWEAHQSSEQYDRIYWTTESVEDLMERVWTGGAPSSSQPENLG